MCVFAVVAGNTNLVIYFKEMLKEILLDWIELFLQGFFYIGTKILIVRVEFFKDITP